MAEQKICPICGKSAHKDFTPFCSKRCADIDLGRWFKGGYAVPVVEDDSDISEDDSTIPEE